MGGGQTASLDYGNELPQPYHGEYSLTRTYSVRSIVAFHESANTHRASLVEKNSEAVIRTTEISTLSDRHARFENGIYTYPYEPIPCGSESPGTGRHPGIRLPSEAGHRYRLDAEGRR